ncbi:hypothetical protein ACPV3A_33145 [Paenibacillus sp. Dod16]|uniref:hypothetical protein n=1 Tax=Paenibacillus sp. Dod16 TaxID=3416392 RepID=UPI003CE91942
MDHLASTPSRSAKPGGFITFGTYPQSTDGADRSPILWRVLQNSGRELRTQGNKPSRAFFVGPSCSIRSYANVSLSRDGVRPALKLTLK